MSAHCYIQLMDVPPPLMEKSQRRGDDVPPLQQLIAFEDCPLVGRIVTGDDGVREIEYPFPRGLIRDYFVSWLMKWGFSFRVEQ